MHSFHQYLKKTFIIFILVMFTLVSPLTSLAQGGYILYHQEEHKEPVAPGVEYITTTRFTSLGWQKIHILQGDLTNPHLKVDTVTSNEGLSRPQPLTKLIQNAQGVAGINGDFFYIGQTNAPLGPVVKDSQLIATPYWSDEMTVFSLTQDLKAAVGPWHWKGHIINASGVQMELGGINKTMSSYDRVVMYTRDWGSQVKGYDFSLLDTVVLTLVDDVVVDYTMNPTEVIIPKEGYILVAEGKTAIDLMTHFPLGTKVKLSQWSSPSSDTIHMAIGGGSNLVHQGTIPPFTHQSTGKHPRSALGITEDNKTLLLVMVEGRNSAYSGMTQMELAQLMVELGCYYAINLDGGGSSTMVARPLGGFTPEVKNGGTGQRLIPNGIGLFSTAPSRSLAGLKIQTTDPRLPLWSIREFQVVGYDQNYNPIPIDPQEVKWSVSNGLGRFEGSTLGTTIPGKGVVTAQVGTVKTSLPIQVIGRTQRLVVQPEQLRLNPGQQRELTVFAVDQDGFRATLSPDHVFPELIGDIGHMKGNVFIAGDKSSTGYIRVTFDQGEGYCPIAVGQDQKIIEGFEQGEDIYFLPYPATVGGSFEKTDFAYAPGVAGKLSFNFTPEPGTQAAYLVFGEGGRPLPQGSTKLGVWVYSDRPYGHWLRGQITDNQTGERINLDWVRHIDWEGWKYVETALPTGSTYTLNRLYVVETDPNNMGSGQIVIDQVTVMSPPQLPNIPEGSPKDPKGMKKEQLLSHAKEGGFQFSLLTGKKGVPIGDFTLRLTQQGVDVLKRDGTLVNKHVPAKQYGSFGYDNARFILLDTAKGGIRASDQDQWPWLTEQLSQGQPNQWFIVSPYPLTGFADQKEKDLLLQTLAATKDRSGGEVWLISPGDGYHWEQWNGVRLLSLPQGEEGTQFLVSGKETLYSVD